MSDPEQSGGSWTLLTGHGHVLVEIARNPEARIRDIRAAVGLTERTVQAIVADLEAAGYITRHRTGRRTARLDERGTDTDDRQMGGRLQTRHAGRDSRGPQASTVRNEICRRFAGRQRIIICVFGLVCVLEHYRFA
jgi:hypothetical protein